MVPAAINGKGYPQWSLLEAVLFSIFRNDTDKGIKCTHSRFADDYKLRGGMTLLKDGTYSEGI